MENRREIARPHSSRRRRAGANPNPNPNPNPDPHPNPDPDPNPNQVLLVLAFFAALANRKKHLSHCGLCLRLQCCYALLSRKNYEPDAKGGN